MSGGGGGGQLAAALEVMAEVGAGDSTLMRAFESHFLPQDVARPKGFSDRFDELF